MGRAGRFGQPSAPAGGGAGGDVATHEAAANPHPVYSTDADLAAHEADTTAIHGITNTAALETTAGSAAKVATHEADTTAIHGITDTSVLETTTGSAAKVTTHAGAADPHGDRAFGTAAIATHAGAADPHTGYLQESAAAAVATSGSASDLATGTLPIARIADGAVTLAKFANEAEATVLGRALGAGTGVPVALTAAQQRAILALTGALVADLPWWQTWSVSGVPVVTTDSTAKRWKNKTGRTITITAVCASAVTAPASTSLIFDLNKNGTTMYTTQGNRPTIAVAGNTVDATLPDVLTIADGDFITMNVDQAGATVADVTFQVFGKLG